MAASEEHLAGLEIRPLAELSEFLQTLSLQKRIWGFDESDAVAPRLFSVYRHTGGSVQGAFIDGEMVGYTLAFAAFKPDHSVYWHSHMAGVLPEFQGRGIGRRLKLRQREEALAAGIGLIEWTFDPFQVRNAYFNIERLGVVVDEYLPNLYGVTSSELHGSLPTDRLVAGWHLESPRVVEKTTGGELGRLAVEQAIDIPADVTKMSTGDGVALQRDLAAAFQSAFKDGLSITAFDVTADGGRYLLTRRVM